MGKTRSRKLLALWVGLVVSLTGGVAVADEATGKLVWIDKKNSNLLLECPDNGCPKIPNSKPGETYSFVIPAKLKAKLSSLKEGQTVTIVYDDAKEKGYVITAVNDK
jgi:hypothetical protein